KNHHLHKSVFIGEIKADGQFNVVWKTPGPVKAKDVPVVAFSVGEEELRGVDTKPLVGHLAAWNYFMSIKNPANDEFVKKWGAYAKAKNIAGHKDKPLTNDPMEATYIGINMWKQAVEKAKSTDVDKVIAAMAGQTFKAPSGITSKMDEKKKTTTCTSRCLSVKSRLMASSMWCGRPRAL
ncbi:MAG: Aliphatic amidase expression-regulating protein, partial [Pseudomonadota bacterium]